MARQLEAHCSAACLELLDARALAELPRSSEPVYALTAVPGLLLLARSVLVSGAPLLTHMQSVWWWSGRCTLAHQALLENNALELKEYAERCFATAVRDVSESEPGNLENNDEGVEEGKSADAVQVESEPIARRRENSARLLLLLQALVESAHADFTFWNYRRMMRSLDRAKLVSGLRAELTGARGMRTKFQQDVKSQLFVDAHSAPRTLLAEACVLPGLAAAPLADSLELEKQHQVFICAY